MAKIYTPKPALGPVGQAVVHKSPTEKSKLKVEVLAHCGIPLAFVYRGYHIELFSPPSIWGDLLGVYLRAFKNGQEIFIDNPLLYQNPPIMVPDGTFRKEKDADGNEIEVMNFKEDPLEALKEIIVQTVEATGK